jgi:hypothetical protein
MNRHTTTQDISWFLDLHNNDRLDLNPAYQRRSIWSNNDRRFFLDTVFRNYPCPAIFIHKSADKEERPIYHVVDGKQRLETIIMFSQNKLALPKDFGDIHLDGKKWRHLGTDEKNRFWNYTLSVEMLSSVEGTLVNEIFDRFNRNSRKLERQELRHARYDGWFIQVAEEESEKDEWQKLKIVTRARAKRMKDVQFISELLLITLDKEIVGFDQDHLDARYGVYDNFDESDEDEDATATVSKEQFYEGLNKTKAYILAMEEENACVTNFSTSFTNFYTLWGVVSLIEGLPDPKLAADKYAIIMTDVQTVANLKPTSEEQEVAEVNPIATKYYFGTQGANTDLSRRVERFDALSFALTA